MSAVTNTLIVILLGMLSTIQLHISKAMERQGIEVFDQIRAKLQSEGKDVDGGAKKPLIYIIGLILNNTVVVYSYIAQLYGAPALFTSVFGIGLIALMIYSNRVLKEEIQRIEIYGAIVLIIGTIIVGAESLYRPKYDMSTVNSSAAVIGVFVFLAIGAGIMTFAFKKGTPPIVGVIFGLFAGGCGGLDPFFKSVGLYEGSITGDNKLPVTLLGWILFGSSFIVAVLAFTFTQWGFAKKAKASVLVPAYNSTYVVMPLLFQIIFLPNYAVFASTVIGVALIIIGMVMMQVFKKEKPKPILTPDSLEEIPTI